MRALIDYDNIPSIERRRGLDYLIRRILDQVGSQNLTSVQRVSFRLYGGWFEGNQKTRTAQQLVADFASFPKAVNVGGSSGSVSPIVAVELAQSLAADPRRILQSTFRKSSIPNGLRCSPPPYYMCIDDRDCPVRHVHEFVESGQCPKLQCGLSAETTLLRDEQKLVDTMLVADAIYFAHGQSETLIIVSSDDDVWIGIKTALLYGAKVIHVHTRTGRQTPRYYSQGAGPNYVEVSI